MIAFGAFFNSDERERRLRHYKGLRSLLHRGPLGDEQPLDTGRKLRDVLTNQTGVILDRACWYAHP